MNSLAPPIQETPKRIAESNLKKLVAKQKKNLRSLSVIDSKWNDESWLYQRLQLLFSSADEGQLAGAAQKVCNRTPFTGSILQLAKAFTTDYIKNKELALLPKKSTVQELLTTIGFFGSQLKIDSISELHQDHYDDLVTYICARYTNPANSIAKLNQVVKYINKNRLAVASIQTEKTQKYSKTDEFGNPNSPLAEKMPERELVKSIIDLRHAIFDSNNKSEHINIDKLCITTQAFQYGMGLRLTEILRLPFKCVRRINGRPHLLVWPEKGPSPQARPIPKRWQNIILDAVKTVKQLTVRPRKVAREIENTGRLSLIDKRFQKITEKKHFEYHAFCLRVKEFLLAESNRISPIWQLPKSLKKKKYLDVLDMTSLQLPNGFGRAGILNDIERKGIPSQVIRKKKNSRIGKRTVVKTNDFQIWLDSIIHTRRSHLTEVEFIKLLQGSDYSACISRLAKGHLKKFTSTIFRPNAAGRGQTTAIPLEAVFDIAKTMIYGNYDHKNWIPAFDLHKDFPGMTNNTGAYDKFIKSRNLDVRTQTIYTIRNKTKTRPRCYAEIKNGKLLSRASLHDNIITTFKRYSEASMSVTDEIEDEGIEIEDEGIGIESASFSIKQKLSEFLFLVFDRQRSSEGLKYKGIIPKNLTYNAVNYFFCSRISGRGIIIPSAFERYNITINNEQAIKNYQSHKGRHWQTTSLFRAGAPDFAVDLYMGRTPGQGRQYDHNTGTERAIEIKELLATETHRFVGPVADKVRAMRKKGVGEEAIKEYIDDTVDTIHYTPYGGCFRNVVLNPCPYSVRCVKGKSGNGCKHLIVEKGDEVSIVNIIDFKDKTEGELQKLFFMHENGNVHAEKHIEHNLSIIRNCDSILAQISNGDGTGTVQPFPLGDSPEENPFLK